MSPISPIKQYQALVTSNEIIFDPTQQQAVELLQQLYLALHSTTKVATKKITTKSQTKNSKTKGIYLWGKVGRGKTFLMDLFVSSLPSFFVKRQHFHHFMQDVHQQLSVLTGKTLSGKPNPLKLIAEQFSQQYRVLCFDEFFVSDIGDAMLLGNLLQYMFELNIVVVSTSNCAPHELYKNGLQRDRFLPAIAAIEQHTQVLNLSGEHDHRHRTLTYKQNYFELAKTEQEQIALHEELLSRFGLLSMTKTQNESIGQLNVLGRNIRYMAKNTKVDLHNSVICFEFADLCQGPRSHFDYVEIAKQFSTILLFNIPPMSGQSYERIKARGTEDNGSGYKRLGYKSSGYNVSAAKTGEREVVLAPMDDAARRFIALVDECYDCNVNLVMSAYVPKIALYNSGTLMFEFERTKSRLVEMASMDYLAKKQLKHS